MSDVGNPSPPRVAVVGLGQMGAGIARNLNAAGLLRAVFDIDASAAERAGLNDALQSSDLTDLFEAADVVLFAVPGTAQISRALAAIKIPAGRTIIDVTTSDPDQSRALAQDLAAQDVMYVDAAMTGGAAGADAGTLTLMVGGDADIIARCAPVFDAIADRVFHLGPTGSGHAMKLVHNMILHSSFLATCEGLKLAERAGLDASLAVDVLNAGNARSFVTDTRFPRDILSGTMQARSTIANLEKDLGLAVAFSEGLEARHPIASLTRSILATAVETGRKDTDFSWLYPLYDDLIKDMEAGK